MGFVPSVMTLRAGLCCVLVLASIVPSLAQIPPGSPSISGPQVIIMGNQVTLTCSVTGGSPTPSVRWLRDNTVIDDTYTTVGQTTTNEFSFTASPAEHLEVFECQSENGVLQNPLARTKFVEVYRPPSIPTLTGPTTFRAGSPATQWTCTSVGAYPVQQMTMRVGNTQFNSNQFTTSFIFDQSTESYTMTGTLNWAPTMANNGATVYCDVTHSQTLQAPQTVSLPLTVTSPLAVNAPVPLYSPKTGDTITLRCDVTSGTATGIRWYKNNLLMQIQGNGRYSGAVPGNPSLSINQVILSDTGNYICEATDGSIFRNTSVITVQTMASPSTPTLNGPTSLTAGDTGTWTCRSTGGYPEPRMTMRIENNQFNQLNVQSVFDNAAGSYILTGTLVWQPTLGNSGQTVYCDVTHPETLQAPQTVSLPLTVVSQLAITAPKILYEPNTNDFVTLVCIVTAGTANRIRWFKNDQPLVFLGDVRLSGGSVENPSLNIARLQRSDSGFYVCQGSDNAVTKSSNRIQLNVNASPSLPVLTGPTAITAGETGNWACTSRGGYPQQSLSMRIGSSVFMNNDITINSELDNGSQTYTVTGVVSYAPQMTNLEQTMYCDVTHLGGESQTAQLAFVVKSPLEVITPQTSFTTMEDESLTLTCTVTTGTATSITWYRGVQVIDVASEPDFSGGSVENPSLQIDNIQMSHSGRYICEAADGFTQVRSDHISVSITEKPATEHNIITKLMKGYNKLVRPQDPFIDVTHSLVPMNIMHFDQKQLSLRTQQCMNWNDARLSWPKGQSRVSLPASEIWIPDIVLYGHKFVMDEKTKVIVMKNGNVTYCPKGRITATNCVEKEDETFECTFKFVSWSYDEVMLHKHFPVTGNSVDMSIYHEHRTYEIARKCAVRTEENNFPCRKGTYPMLTYTFIVQRNRNCCRNLMIPATCGR